MKRAAVRAGTFIALLYVAAMVAMLVVIALPIWAFGWAAECVDRTAGWFKRKRGVSWGN